MTDFRDRYKRLGFGRENAQVNRALRSKRHNEHRHERRSQLFGVNRVQNQCTDSSDKASNEDASSSSKRPDEAARTDDKELAMHQAKWRKESYNRKLNEKKANKKPPFVVGIVHHRVYSPPFSKEKIPTPPTRLCKLKENQPVSVQKTVTQATMNRRAAKALESKQKLETVKTKKTKESEKAPLVPETHEFKAPEGLNAIPLFGRRATEAAQQSLLRQDDIQSFSNRSIASFISDESYTLNPYNTSTPIQPPASVSSVLACNNDQELRLSFGMKFSANPSSAEKVCNGDEVHSHEEQTLLPGQPSSQLSSCTVENADEGSTRTELQRSEEATVQKDSFKQEEYTVPYFKDLLSKEIERLNGLCDSWALVKNETSTPEDMHYLIQAAIGQTQLLVRKKFQRFGGLVRDCETGAGEMPVTCKDLLGFWELTYIEVEDCDARFKKLEELKANGWLDREASEAKTPPKRKQSVEKKVPAEKKIVRSNSLKAHIAAARRKLKPVPAIATEEIVDNVVVPETKDPTSEQEKITAGKYQERRNNEETRRMSRMKIPSLTIELVKDESPKVLSIKTGSNQALTPMNKLVLRKAHLSQARKSSKSPLVALKISQMCKTPEVQSDASIACTGLRTTPVGRVLKSPRSKKSSSKSAEKSVRIDSTVKQFNANAECLETVEMEKRTIKKRLSFEENDNSIIASPVKVGDKMPNEEQIAEPEVNSNQSVESPGYFLRNLFYVDTSRRIDCEKVSPVNEDTPKAPDLNGTYSEISLRKNEINLSITSEQKNLRISSRKKGGRPEPTTPRRKSLRIQKLNESKAGNQDA